MGVKFTLPDHAGLLPRLSDRYASEQRKPDVISGSSGSVNSCVVNLSSQSP